MKEENARIFANPPPIKRPVFPRGLLLLFIGLTAILLVLFGLRYRDALVLVLLSGLLAGLILITALIWQRSQNRYFVAALKAESDRTALRGLYESLIQQANDGILLLDDSFRIIEANDLAVTMYGYARSEILQLINSELVAPENRAAYDERVREIVRDGAILREALHRRKDGSRFPVEISARKIALEGRTYYQSIIRDISERRRAESALREAERRFSALLNNVRLVAVGLDREGRVTYANPYLLELTGYAGEEVLGRDWFEMFIPERNRPAVGTAFSEIMAEGVHPHYENPILNRRGEERLIAWNNTLLYDPAGRPEGTMSIGEDVTERQAAYAELMRNNQYVRAILDNAPFGIHMYELGENGRLEFIGANPTADRILGLDHNRLIGLPIEEAFPPLTATDLPAAYRQVARAGCVLARDQIEYDDHKGVRGAFEIRAFQTAERRMAVFFADITTRRRAEQAVRTSEERYRALFENANIGIFHALPEGRFLRANPALASIFGFESAEEMIASVADIATLYVDASRYAFLLAEVLRRRGWIYAENQYRRKDGRAITAWLSLRKELRPDGTVDYLEGFVEDITERREAENALRTALRDREVLLKEIHHRVKNNMQIISSLLNHQARRVDDPRLRDILRDSQNRIRSMALMHEKLYRAEDLARIDFEDYLRGLIVHLLQSLAAGSGRIRFVVEAGGIALDINTAVPLGLLVNELVTNSIKHAFPDGRSGEIRVELRRTGGRSMRLAVSDDGVGFPPGLDLNRPESLGWQLVHMLIDQLEGSVSWSAGPSAAVTVDFRESLVRARY